MKKPELKDYNIDEQRVNTAERKINLRKRKYWLIFWIIVFCLIFLMFETSYNYGTNYIINSIVFGGLFAYYIGIVLVIIYEFSGKSYVKYYEILAKHEKYKFVLSCYLRNQKGDNGDNKKDLLTNSKNKSISITKANVKKPLIKKQIEEPPQSKTEEKYKILSEGKKSEVKLTKYERNARARKLCIEYHKCKCYFGCTSLEKIYGNIAEGFIHVHHIKPISEIGKDYIIDPIKDLIPVCPNCHSIIHTKNPPYTIAEMKIMKAPRKQ